MKQVLVRQGQVFVDDVPAPQVEPGCVLVEVAYSCISAGTELSGIKNSGIPLWKRALQQPDKLRKVLHSVSEQGLRHTWDLVKAKTSTGQPMGYSAAGRVIAVGSDVDGFTVGDAVACAGSQCAFHAQIIRVPQNLVVRVPESVDLSTASTVTLGAIALQGIRRASPTLGESFVVLGLGILGQLSVQLLKANGCRVIGVDLSRHRIQTALNLGLDHAVHPEDSDNTAAVARLTDGAGADGVIITAATPSDTVVATAFQMCRKKGRVILVGDVGLHLNRADFYEKELDFLVSTSYGPGRYDRLYEEKGLDYPVPYVRWTENRNMGEFLRLIAAAKVDTAALTGAIFPVDRAQDAYDSLKGSEARPLVALLKYPSEPARPREKYWISPLPSPVSASKRVRLALIGAGAFAKDVHLPNLRYLRNLYELRAIVSRTGHSAIELARQFQAQYTSTNYEEVLQDPDVDAVLICTRHNLHTKMVLSALSAGKHVLVEKPLAINPQELESIISFYDSSEQSKTKPLLLTGFNRRFSPYASRIRRVISQRSNPMLITYRMNAGYMPLNHWVHTDEGGGRNLGEACHIYDLITSLVGAKASEVSTQALHPKTAHYSSRDNFVTNLKYVDGSVASIAYTALGNREHPKECMEVFFDNKVLVMDDYKSLRVLGLKGQDIITTKAEKGHREELEIFAQTILQATEWPNPFWQQIQATQIALQVEASLMK